ncbi:MAG: hypothetical protein LBU67_09540 [Oscillospiraceae bacterium]|jgi:hypothetical protein|nr:hypothetical protein [Oscillospiraceae bacterium]
MAENFEDLGKRLQALMPNARQRTEEELARAAANKYDPIYNAQVQSAQHTQQQSDLSLAQQVARLLPLRDQAAERIQGETDRGISELNRAMLTRGMQRSSYGLASQAGLQRAGMQQIARSDADYAQQIGHINDQRAQLEKQLAASLGRLEADRAANIAGYSDEMRQQDLQNAMDGYRLLQDLQLSLARMQYQQQRDVVADRQWQAEFDLKGASKQRKSGGSGQRTRGVTLYM